jgi:hypothetical protein
MKTALATDEPVLILEVDGEHIRLDPALIDSPLTPDEAEQVRLMSIATRRKLVDEDGQPTAGMVAISLYVRLARGRDWGRGHLNAVMPLLLAWLTDNLEAT